MRSFQKLWILCLIVALLVPASTVSAQPAAEEALRAPRLLYPLGGALVAKLHPNLVWLRVPGAVRYQVQLTSATAWDPLPTEMMDVSFAPIDPSVWIVRFTTADYPVDGLDWLTPNRFYRWHVRACSGLEESTCGAWSGTRRFLPRYAETDQPQLVAPTNGATLDTLSPLFEWTRLPNDKRYELVIRGPGSIRRIYVAAQGEGNTVVFQPAFNLRGKTEFTWRVRAIGFRSLYFGPWSETFTFTTPPNPNPPDPKQVKLIRPLNNALVKELEPTLKWGRIPSAIRYQVQLSSSNIWDPAPAELMSVNFVPPDPNAWVVVFTAADYSNPLDWLTRNRPYYWRVRACKDDVDDNCYPWSNTRRFIPRYTLEDQPVLVQPGSPDSATLIDTLTPTFVWNRLPNDTKYLFVIGNSKGIWFVWQDVSGTDPTASLTLPNPLATETVYWWKVRALGFRGWYFGPWSEVFYFTTPAAALPIAP